MFIGSREKSEWRVEGESHSLTDALSFCSFAIRKDSLCRSGSTLGEHNGTFKGARRI